jgi:hypothetical protein
MGARAVLQAVLGRQQQQQQHAEGWRSSDADTPGSMRVIDWAGAVVVSGTPGMPDPQLRAARAPRDAELADLLQALGAREFIAWWYAQPLWGSLRQHPRFAQLCARRAAEHAGCERPLAAALAHGSTGRMVSAAHGCVCVCAGAWWRGVVQCALSTLGL